METVRGIARRGPTLILVTHHVEEIIPEIQRVVLLRDGRVAHHGAKADVLTTRALSDTFGAAVTLFERDGYYHARIADLTT
jgi:iron complex transport system ATP-binding protein